jgi:hypothetical protein
VSGRTARPDALATGEVREAALRLVWLVLAAVELAWVGALAYLGYWLASAA